ncbi:MAG: anaerobic ribonucleoside-triphosphate reductase [Candidatus Diapherotrites archaeon]
MATCGKQTEVYSRVVGYYRPVQQWNIGKAQEFEERKTFSEKKCLEREECGKIKAKAK